MTYKKNNNNINDFFFVFKIFHLLYKLANSYLIVLISILFYSKISNKFFLFTY